MYRGCLNWPLCSLPWPGFSRMAKPNPWSFSLEPRRSAVTAFEEMPLNFTSRLSISNYPQVSLGWWPDAAHVCFMTIQHVIHLPPSARSRGKSYICPIFVVSFSLLLRTVCVYWIYIMPNVVLYIRVMTNNSSVYNFINTLWEWISICAVWLCNYEICIRVQTTVYTWQYALLQLQKLRDDFF